MELTQEQLLKKQIWTNKLKIATDVILIIVLLGIGLYIYQNIEAFKTLGSDVCKLCMNKTGAICSKVVLK